jgi:hypothetical protein
MAELMRTQSLLQENAPRMSASMRAALKEGRLVYSDGFYYKRVKLPTGASGMQNLLLNDDSQKDGYCSISKQKIQQGCAFECDRMTFKAFAVLTANLGTADQASVKYVPIQDLTDVLQLACAELEVTVNGETKFRVPVNAFNQETYFSNSAKDGINISAPFFVNDEQLLQFRLHLPQDLSIDATYTVFVEVAMYGAECRIAQ